MHTLFLTLLFLYLPFTHASDIITPLDVITVSNLTNHPFSIFLEKKPSFVEIILSEQDPKIERRLATNLPKETISIATIKAINEPLYNEISTAVSKTKIWAGEHDTIKNITKNGQKELHKTLSKLFHELRRLKIEYTWRVLPPDFAHTNEEVTIKYPLNTTVQTFKKMAYEKLNLPNNFYQIKVSFEGKSLASDIILPDIDTLEMNEKSKYALMYNKSLLKYSRLDGNIHLFFNNTPLSINNRAIETLQLSIEPNRITVESYPDIDPTKDEKVAHNLSKEFKVQYKVMFNNVSDGLKITTDNATQDSNPEIYTFFTLAMKEWASELNYKVDFDIESLKRYQKNKISVPIPKNNGSSWRLPRTLQELKSWITRNAGALFIMGIGTTVFSYIIARSAVVQNLFKKPAFTQPHSPLQNRMPTH